jgi:hypothetical protein
MVCAWEEETMAIQESVQNSDQFTSASFQPLAVVPSGSRKTPLKRSRSSPAAQPLGSLGGTASRSRPCFPPSSSRFFASKKASQVMKHCERGVLHRSNRQKNGDSRMARFFCPHSPVDTVFTPVAVLPSGVRLRHHIHGEVIAMCSERARERGHGAKTNISPR